MPAAVTHQYFAEFVLHDVPAPVKARIGACEHAFYWGAQGPDILFFHHAGLLSRAAALGYEMHMKKVPRTARAMAAACPATNGTLFSYFLGFLCHYALDSTAHPFVRWTVKEKLVPESGECEGAEHRRCESELDYAVLLRRVTKAPALYRMATHLTPESDILRAVGTLYARVGWEVFGHRVSPLSVRSSMLQMRLILRALHDESGKKITNLQKVEGALRAPHFVSALVRPQAANGAHDIANDAHMRWFVPEFPDVTSQESFFDLLDRARQKAVSLLCRAYAGTLSTGDFLLDFEGLPCEGVRSYPPIL